MTTDSVADGPPRYRSAWLAIGVVALAIAMRLIGSTFSFDGDEIFSMVIARGDFDYVIERSLLDKPHPPLHNILLHLWIIPFGISEVSARLLSILLSAASILIVFSMLRTRVRTTVALCAAVALCLSAFFITYGQQARPYALIALLGVLNIWALFKVLNEPERRANSLLWAATAVPLVFSQYFGAIYLLVEGCILLASLKVRTAIKVLVPAVIASVTVLPWMYMAFSTGESLAEIEWIEKPYLRSMPDFYLGSLGWPQSIPGWILLPLVAALCVAGVARLIAEKRREQLRYVLIVAIIAVVPPLIAFLLSFVLKFSIWAPRQLMISAFGYVALLAMLADALPKAFRVTACVLLVAWALAGMSDGLPSHGKPPWRAIVQTIEQAHPNATITGQEWWTTYSLAYYMQTSQVKRVEELDAADTPRTVYYVCRPPYCEQLSTLTQRLGAATLVRSDDWNYVGGQPQNVVRTYRLGSAAE